MEKRKITKGFKVFNHDWTCNTPTVKTMGFLA